MSLSCEKCFGCKNHFVKSETRLFQWKRNIWCYDCYCTPKNLEEIHSSVKVLHAYLIHKNKVRCTNCKVTLIDVNSMNMMKNYNFAHEWVNAPIIANLYEGRFLPDILTLAEKSDIYCESCYTFYLAFPTFPPQKLQVRQH